jgi:hypothetical protein
VAQAIGVVHIFVSGKATKYRLPEQPGQCMPTILATACVGQNITRYLGQTECVVEFAISQIMPGWRDPHIPTLCRCRITTPL